MGFRSPVPPLSVRTTQSRCQGQRRHVVAGCEVACSAVWRGKGDGDKDGELNGSSDAGTLRIVVDSDEG